MDKTYDGLVKIDAEANGGDYTAAPAINGLNAPQLTGEFVRAGVIFYSPSQPGGDLVKSWE